MACGDKLTSDQDELLHGGRNRKRGDGRREASKQYLFVTSYSSFLLRNVTPTGIASAASVFMPKPISRCQERLKKVCCTAGLPAVPLVIQIAVTQVQISSHVSSLLCTFFPQLSLRDASKNTISQATSFQLHTAERTVHSS